MPLGAKYELGLFFPASEVKNVRFTIIEVEERRIKKVEVRLLSGDDKITESES